MTDSVPHGGTGRIVRLFEERFGRRPEIVARAPGRVNLIGEHTDYNGLPVLPMALDRAVLVAAAPRGDAQVVIASTAPGLEARTYVLRNPIPPFRSGDWGNYPKAAAQGLLTSLGLDDLPGGDLLVDANLPAGAGLASSAALVVGTALAMLALNSRTVEGLRLAEILATAERYVGTESGGMDQAVCLLAEPGCALRIDFDPLRTRSVPIFSRHRFVLCHSLEEAMKAGASREAYNRRVTECRLACRVLEGALGASLPRPARHFGELVAMFPDRSMSSFVTLLEERLLDESLPLARIAEIVGVSQDALAASGGVRPQSEASYALVRRARHVLLEADRVERAERALASDDWMTFARLMDASHASCRDDYEISSAALEATIQANRRAGAVGARLTGAGFGGCTLSLVAEGDVETFKARMERDFYRDDPQYRAAEHCFEARAGEPASVLRL